MERFIFVGLIDIEFDDIYKKCLQSAARLYSVHILFIDNASTFCFPFYIAINWLHVNDNQMVSANPVSYYWRDTTIDDSNKQIMPMCIIINIRPR